MAYMECLPESMRDAADWALNCEDGELLPCHSLFLASTCRIFTNFAGLGESVTAKKNNKNEIPLEETVNIAEAFLDWMYSHKITTEAPMLYRLAALAHRLNAPDLAEHHRLLMTRTKALKGTEKVMLSCADWAELAGDYDLPRLSNICIKHFIEGNRDHGTKLNNVSSSILASVLNGKILRFNAMEAELRGKKHTCKYYSSRNEVCKND